MLRKWLPALAASNEEIHRLNEALDAVTNDDTASLDWSRRAMQKFHELDLAIASIPDFNSWQLMSISTIYAYNDQFREDINTLVTDTELTETRTIKLDLIGNKIMVPKIESAMSVANHEFDFDFSQIAEDTQQAMSMAKK
ncbi:hypothetical protein SCUP515_10877 [Seiridium cupressi]